MSAIREVLYGEFRRVSYVYRYSAVPVQNRENVAEHSWWTAMIAVTIAVDLELKSDMVADVALRAMLHDIEEIGTGDLVREAKYFDEQMREDFRRVEEAFAERLFGKLGDTGAWLMTVWSMAKGDDLSGRIVALADLLCVVAYCRHEKTLGNKNIGHIESECLKLIDQKFGDDPVLEPIVAEATHMRVEDYL